MASNKGADSKKGSGGNAAEIARLQTEMQKSQKRMWVGVGVAVLAVIALVIGVIIMINNQDSSPEVRPTAAPSQTTTAPTAEEEESMPMDLPGVPSGGIIYNPSGKPLDDIVTLSIYSDYMCSYCEAFEETYGEKLTKMADEGQIALDFHPLPYLDKESFYSTRTAMAAFAVGTLENAKLPAFNAALLGNRPQSDAEALTDEQIAEIARQTGVSEEIIAKFAADEYRIMTQNAMALAKQDIIKGTPTVLFDGARYRLTRDDFNPVGPSIFLAMLDSKIEAKK